MRNVVESNFKEKINFLKAIPFVFLGTGFYRAWIEILFLSPKFNFPESAIASFNIHDLSMAIALLLCAAFAKQLSPLFKKKLIFEIGALIIFVSSVLKLSSLYISYSPIALSLVDLGSSLGAGVGSALLILLWAELFSSLSPLKVALSYTLSFALGFFLVHGLALFSSLGQVIYSILLPLLSLLMVYKAFTRIAQDDLPPESYESFPIPWKPVVMMLLFAFAYGLREQAMYQNAGPMSSLGLLLSCVIVLIALVLIPNNSAALRFLRYVLPGIAVIGLVVSMLSSDFYFSNVSLNLGFNAFNIFIMFIFANIAYRYGVSALWLFGIERGVRALTMVGSRYLSNFIPQHEQLYELFTAMNPYIVILLLLAFSYLVINQKSTKDDWGVVSNKKLITDPHILEKARIAQTVDAASTEYKLTPRQTEVFELLIKGKTISEIESSLVIAKGTAKAHMSNIYQKVGVSSRDQLLAKFSK